MQEILQVIVKTNRDKSRSLKGKVPSAIFAGIRGVGNVRIETVHHSL